MATRIEHEAALARIEEMRRYADARRRPRRSPARRGHARQSRAALTAVARRLRLA